MKASIPPVPWYQDPAEFGELLDLVRSLNPKSLLEIGSFYGGTLWQWIYNLPAGTLVVAVDRIVPQSDPRYRGVMHTKTLWQGWADGQGIGLRVIHKDSTWKRTVRAVSAYAPFDFILVDGGHEYKTICADYENYYPMLAPGGLMAFHDISNAKEPDAIRFWDKLKKQPELVTHEIIQAPSAWGIGIVQR